MPVYNSKETLTKAIQSVLNQEYKCYELIIVDDCSTDGSYEIAEGFAAENKNIRLCRMKRNYGAPHCMNIGVKYAKYIWVGIIDSDALEPKNWLETVVNNMQEGVSAIGGKCSHEKDKCKSYFKKVFYFIETKSIDLKNEVYDKNNFKEPNIVGANFFFTKQVFIKNKGFEECIRVGYDRLFLCDAIENGFRVKYVSNLVVYHPLYNYRGVFDIFKRAYTFSTWRVMIVKRCKLMNSNYRKMEFTVALLILMFVALILLQGVVKALLLSSILIIIFFLLSTCYINIKMNVPYIYTFGVILVEIIKKLIGIYVYCFRLKPKKMDWKNR